MCRQIHLYLKGGLGNQMFQAAFAIGLSKKNMLRLTVDNQTGFELDRKYRRKYELGSFFEEDELTFSSWVTLKRLWNKYPKVIPFLRHFGIQVVDDNRAFNRQALINVIDGYFQDESLWNHATQEIKLRLGRLMPGLDGVRTREYISVGLRLYEEADTPEKYCRSGRPFDWREFLDFVIKENSNSRIRLFTYKTTQELKLYCSENNIIINEGLSSEQSLWETLEEFALGRRIYFNQSTFYWWGAWASESLLNRSSRDIFAYDDFLEFNTLPSRWNKIKFP